MLFKNGFNVIIVQIQRILMWRFWTVRDLNLEWELYAIPLYLPTSHFLYITPESAVLPPQSCTYLVSSGQHTAGGPQIGVNNFWNFWNNLAGTASKWFLLFFSDFPVFQFVTFNCSYDIDYMPKNIEIKKFKGFKHLPMYQVCCLPLVYCFKYNKFVKKHLCCVQLVIRFFILYLEYLRPLRPWHFEDGAPICLVTGSWSG